MLTFGFATIFCALVPNGQDLRPAVMEHHNFCTWLLQNTTIWTPTPMCCPASMCWGCWTPSMPFTGRRDCGAPDGALSQTYGASSSSAPHSLSKQHAFIDVVAALVVGAIAYVIIYTIIGGRRDRRMAAAGKGGPLWRTYRSLRASAPMR